MDDTNTNIEQQPKGDFSTAPPWRDRAQTLAILGFSVLIVAAVFAVQAVIPFALTTVVISYLLFPITDFIAKRLTFGQRGLAVLLTYTLIVLLIIVSMLSVLPPLIDQSINAITTLLNNATLLLTEPIIIGEESMFQIEGEAVSLIAMFEQTLQAEGFESIADWIEANLTEINIDRDTILQIFGISGDIATGLLGSVVGLAGSAIGFALNLLFFLVISGSMLGSGRAMVDNIIAAAPDGFQDDLRRLLADLGGVWDGYVRGNLTLGLIMGTAMWIIATVLGLPNPLFLAVVAGIMEFIPNLGPTIAMAIAGAVAVISGSSTFPEMSHLLVAGLVILVWFVMQQLEATVLVPRIQGENLKLHPVIVILAVIWGSSFGGLVGVIIAPPLIASARIVLQYLYGRLTNRPAFSSQYKPGRSIGRDRRTLIWLRFQRGINEFFSGRGAKK